MTVSVLARRPDPLLITQSLSRALVGRINPEPMAVTTDAPIGRDAALKAVLWLKRNFGREIEKAVDGTAYSVDTICGIACQETAYFWLNMLERLTPEQVCARCVLDASGDAPDTVRRAFPRNTSAFRKNMEMSARKC